MELDKISGSDGQEVPASLVKALIEQGRIEGDSQAIMEYSIRL